MKKFLSASLFSAMIIATMASCGVVTKTFQITWNVDGQEPKVTTVNSGAMPSYGAEDPTKAETADHYYTFSGWEPAIYAADKDQTYIAQFNELGKFVVTFDANGHGTAPASVTVKENYTFSAPTAPTEAGYTFGGWYKEAGCTNAWNFAADQVKAAMTLYAKWTANDNVEYQVEHHLETLDGTSYYVEDTDLLTGTTGAQTAAAAKSYTGFTAQTFEQATIAGDGSTVVKIYYNRNTYIVSFNVEGHGTAPAEQEIKYGNKATEPTAPSETSYTFGGWYKEAECINKWNFNTDIVEDAIELHAKWTEVEDTKYEVKHHKEKLDGEYAWFDTETKYGAAGHQTKASAMSIDGFTAQPFSQQVISELGTTVVNVYYNRNIYTVTFDANGHGTAPAAQNIKFEGAVTEPTAPTEEGYVFGGWFREAGCVNEWDFANDYVLDVMTLYAKWTAAEYTVTLNGNGADSQTKNSMAVTYGEAYGDLGVATKAGHTFNGWFTEQEGGTEVTAETVYNIADDSTLYAHFTANTYKITFVPNNGDNSIEVDGTYGQHISAPIVTVPTFMKFDGWYEEEELINKVDLATYVVEGIDTLYCKYTPVAQKLASIDYEGDNFIFSQSGVTNARLAEILADITFEVGMDKKVTFSGQDAYQTEFGADWAFINAALSSAKFAKVNESNWYTITFTYNEAEMSANIHYIGGVYQGDFTLTNVSGVSGVFSFNVVAA